MPPALMDPGMMEHISAAAEAHAPDDWVVMPSGAGHDAQRIAEVMPAAMLFVPRSSPAPTAPRPGREAIPVEWWGHVYVHLQ